MSISTVIGLLVLDAHIVTYDDIFPYLKELALVFGVVTLYLSALYLKFKRLEKKIPNTANCALKLHKYLFWKHEFLVSPSLDTFKPQSSRRLPVVIHVKMTTLKDYDPKAHTQSDNEVIMANVGASSLWFTTEEWRKHYVRLSKDPDILLTNQYETKDNKPLSAFYFYTRFIGLALVGVLTHFVLIGIDKGPAFAIAKLVELNWIPLVIMPVVFGFFSAYKLNKSYQALPDSPEDAISDAPRDSFQTHLQYLRWAQELTRK